MADMDVYENRPEDWFPGAKVRSRPGAALDAKEEVYEKVPDANGNLVSLKPANKAFLHSKRSREKHLQKVAEQERLRSSYPPSNGLGGWWKPFILLGVFLPLLSSFILGNYTFNLSSTYGPPLRKYWRLSPLNPYRVKLLSMSPEELALYDGRDRNVPLYLAVGGEVYDVSSNRRIYGPGGSYSTMAGKDASRSFITGCFQEHQTHDLRGLSDDELRALEGWKSFFANHEKYKLVGNVRNPPIDPNSPIPPDCRSSEASTNAGGSGGAVQGHGKQGKKPGPVKDAEKGRL